MKTIIGKKINNCKQKLSFFIYDSNIKDSQFISNELKNVFVSISCKPLEKIVSTVSPLSYVNQVNNSIFFIEEVSVTEVRTTILSLNNSTPGWDQFPTFVAKNSIDNYIMPLTHISSRRLDLQRPLNLSAFILRYV